MSHHEHKPVEFYSDAFEKPLMVQCEECGKVLDISADGLDSLYADSMTENETRSTP